LQTDRHTEWMLPVRQVAVLQAPPAGLLPHSTLSGHQGIIPGLLSDPNLQWPGVNNHCQVKSIHKQAKNSLLEVIVRTASQLLNSCLLILYTAFSICIKKETSLQLSSHDLFLVPRNDPFLQRARTRTHSVFSYSLGQFM
jgi:hypothetical protein